MRSAISETDRRRAIQVAYNERHQITPTTIVKGVAEEGNLLAIEDKAPSRRRRRQEDEFDGPDELEKTIVPQLGGASQAQNRASGRTVRANSNA